MVDTCCPMKPKLSSDPAMIESNESIDAEADDQDDSESSNDDEVVITLQTRRWFVLASYCMLSCVCGSTWLCFPAVSNIMRSYYSIDILAVNMLSIVFCIALVIFTVPFAMLLDRFGLAAVMKLSAFLNLTGSIIKLFGDDQGYGYWLLLCGNTFHALSIASYLFLPGNIASTWFGVHEMGKAISICVAFDALGTGFGFLLATTLIQNDPDQTIVQRGIKTFLTSQMILSAAGFFFVCLFVRKRPVNTPNPYDSNQRKQQELMVEQDLNDSIVSKNYDAPFPHQQGLLPSLIKLFKNSDFQLIFHMQGIVASVEGLFEILLNEMLISLFPGAEKSIGILGFVAVILGFTTNILAGTVLDKTGYYRKISLGVFLSATLLSVLWLVAIEKIHNFFVIATVLTILMSTMTSYYTIAFAHSVQVTCCIPPAATGVMLVLTSQIYDAITSFAGTELLERCGARTVNCFIIFLCLIASILSFFVKDRRPSNFV